MGSDHALLPWPVRRSTGISFLRSRVVQLEIDGLGIVALQTLFVASTFAHLSTSDDDDFVKVVQIVVSLVINRTEVPGKGLPGLFRGSIALSRPARAPRAAAATSHQAAQEGCAFRRARS